MNPMSITLAVCCALVALLMTKTAEATVGITILSGTTVLAATTAAQTTVLAAGALGVLAAGKLAGYFIARGKRDVSGQSIDEAQLLISVFETMDKSDPADCFRRLVCDLATGKANDFQTLPIMNVVEDDVALPLQFENFKYNLRIASKVGAKVQDVAFCEEVFSCPFTGLEIDQLVSDYALKTGQNGL